MDVMMGDLVLTQDEVNPVMSAVLAQGLDVTALHNHFFWESPRMLYMHVHGHGAPADLDRRIKPALDLIGKVSSKPEPASTLTSTVTGGALDTSALAKIVMAAISTIPGAAMRSSRLPAKDGRHEDTAAIPAVCACGAAGVRALEWNYASGNGSRGSISRAWLASDLRQASCAGCLA